MSVGRAHLEEREGAGLRLRLQTDVRAPVVSGAASASPIAQIRAPHPPDPPPGNDDPFDTLVSLLQLALPKWARPSNTPTQATASRGHRQIARKVGELITQRHFTRPQLNDAFSGRVFDQFVGVLDPQQQFITQRDIDALTANGTARRFDDMLRTGSVEPAFALYNRVLNRQRAFARFAMANYKTIAAQTHNNPLALQDGGETTRVEDPDSLESSWRRLIATAIRDMRKEASSLGEPEGAVLARTRDAFGMLTALLNADSETHSDRALDTLLDSAMATADPHSTFLSVQEADSFMSQPESAAGIGVALVPNYRDDGDGTFRSFPRVTDILDEGPAFEAGIQEGDVIIEARQSGAVGVNLANMNPRAASQLITGDEGTDVWLTIVRGGEAPREIRVTRRPLPTTPLVDSAILEVPGANGEGTKKIGVIKLGLFYENAPDDNATTAVHQELQRLQQHGIEGLILDLRGNPGGHLHHSVAVPGLFVPQGPMSLVKYGDGEISAYADGDANQYYEGPMAVLVDRGSASASEITAAALQDYGRAVVVGERTHGKGTVQIVTSETPSWFSWWDEPYAYKLTTAKFYRPTGETTQRSGVTPNFILGEPNNADYGERTLPNALSADEITGVEFAASGETASTLARRDALLEEIRTVESVLPTDESLPAPLREYGGEVVSESEDSWLFQTAQLVSRMEP